MIFYNIFTNMHSSIIDEQSQLIKDTISKLLVLELNDGTTLDYSSPLTNEEESNLDLQLNSVWNEIYPTIDTRALQALNSISFLTTLDFTRLNNPYGQSSIRGAYSNKYTEVTYSIFNRNTPSTLPIYTSESDHVDGFVEALFNYLNIKKEKSFQIKTSPEAHQEMINQGYLCWTYGIDSYANLFHSDQLTTDDDLSPNTPFFTLKYIRAILAHVLINNYSELELSEALQSVNASRNDTNTYELTFFISALNSYKQYVGTQSPNIQRSIRLLNIKTCEEKINLLLEINTTRIHEYVKQSEIGTINNKKVFSYFNKGFLEIINGDEGLSNCFIPSVQVEDVDYDEFIHSPFPTGSVYNNWDFDNKLLNGHSLYSPYRTSNFIPLGDGCGFSFSRNFSKAPLKEQLENHTASRIKGFMMNKFTKASSKPDFEIVSLTKKQAGIRKGFFIPSLFSIKYQNENLETVEGYSLGLLCVSSTYNEVRKKRRSQAEIMNFSEKYINQNGLYFTDRKQYEENIKTRLASLVTYTSATASTFEAMSDTMLSRAITCQEKVYKTLQTSKNSVDSSLFDFYTSQVIIPPALKRKYTKITNHYDALTDKKQQYSTNIKTLTNEIDVLINEIKEHEKSIAHHKETLKRKQAKLLPIGETLKSTFTKRNDIQETLSLNKNLYENISEKYNYAIENAHENNLYSTNSFFTNLLENEAIQILKIKFWNTEIDQEIELDFTRTQQKINNYKDTTKFKIKHIEFLIDKPTIIAVDGGSKGYKVGGPYLVRVNQEEIYLALAYPNSIHGRDINDYMYMHPHTSSFSTRVFKQNIDESSTSLDAFHWYRRGCLGEAASLIYNAFEKNDLKLILMATLTWIKNANSTDTWGKNYKYFPDATELNDYENELPIVTEDEVYDFIADMLENDIEENALPESTDSEDANTTELVEEEDVYVPFSNYTRNNNEIQETDA